MKSYFKSRSLQAYPHNERYKTDMVHEHLATSDYYFNEHDANAVSFWSMICQKHKQTVLFSGVFQFLKSIEVEMYSPNCDYLEITRDILETKQRVWPKVSYLWKCFVDWTDSRAQWSRR